MLQHNTDQMSKILTKLTLTSGRWANGTTICFCCWAGSGSGRSIFCPLFLNVINKWTKSAKKRPHPTPHLLCGTGQQQEIGEAISFAIGPEDPSLLVSSKLVGYVGSDLIRLGCADACGSGVGRWTEIASDEWTKSWGLNLSSHMESFSPDIFRHTSVSSTYPCLSVGDSFFKFPFYQRLWFYMKSWRKRTQIIFFNLRLG